MAKVSDNSLVIQVPRQGIAPSPHVGFADVRNLDLYTIPGIARMNKRQSPASGVSTLSQWLKRVPLTSSDLYALSSTGVFSYSKDGIVSTWLTITGSPVSNAHGNGLEIFNDFACVARDAFLDFYGPLSSATFTTIFGATTASVANPMVITTTNDHLLSVDDRVTLWSTGHITSSGSVEFANTGTAYFVNTIGSSKTFTLSATSGGVELSTAGGSVSGTVTFKVWKNGSVAEGTGTPTTALTSDNLWHPMLVSKLDGNLYGGAANQVFKLTQVVGQTFNPFNANTFTFSTTALTTALPSDYRIKCIAEFGTNLYLGTWKGTNVTSFAVADIFPWDTTSTALGNPIILNDFGVHALLTYGSSLIIWAGVNGTVYRSDGVSFSPVARLPMDVSATEYVIWSPGAVAIYKERIYFGTGNVQSALPGQGVYSLQFTSKENILTLEHTVSQETDGTNEQTLIASLLPISGQSILVGYVSAATSKIDFTSSGGYNYTTSYTAYFDTPLYVVGKIDNKRLFNQVSFQFTKKLLTGEGIRISYRTSLTDSFTTLGTWTMDVAGTTILGSVFSHQDTANIPTTEMVQLRIALLGTVTTTPQLKSVTFS